MPRLPLSIRIAALPFIALAELLTLLLCWLLAYCHPRTARRLWHWAQNTFPAPPR